MLNYTVTIAISAYFVPHYIGGLFWDVLRHPPGDIIAGAVVIAVLCAINIVGVKESAGLNIALAVVDFLTQVLLVLVGAFLVLSPSTLVESVDLGTAPTWEQFLLAIPVGMIAYTGIETVSNLAEEARDPVKNVPRAYLLTAIAVFAIFFTLPAIALSALPVREVAPGEFETLLGVDPPEGFKNDPVLGLVENMGLHGMLLDVLKIYVGVLAATILFIATNAGVIGASRITYAMAGYRQLPEIFRRIHPRFKTPWISLLVFAGLISILTLLPGEVNFLGTMYSFGAMLSFTVAHISLIALRQRRRDEELPFRGRPNLRFRGIDWPVFAVVGGIGTGLAWLVVVVEEPATRYAGLGWLAFGFAAYYAYRRRVVGAPLRETVRAPIPIGPAIALEYRNILVPVKPGRPSEEAVDFAARLATERRASIALVSVVVTPLELPLDTRLEEEEDRALAVLDSAAAIAELYGVKVTERMVRARNAGRAIVDEATSRTSEIIVMGAPRGDRPGRQLFSDTVDFVLKHAPCRVMVAAGRKAA
jgi:basic amino acid/polyamine antiporter, APA family